MPDRKISELDTLAQVDIDANLDFLPIADTSTSETKKVTTAAIVFSALGSLSSLSVGGTISAGSGSSAAQLTSNGAQNLFLTTNSGVNSGTITIIQGSNGNIELVPSGSGNIFLSSNTVRLGKGSSDAVLTSWSGSDLVLNSGTGINSGNVRINNGVNENIEINTNGTGALAITAAGGTTISAQGTTPNSVTTKQYVDIQALVSGIVFGV